jgi:hypothetical protein
MPSPSGKFAQSLECLQELQGKGAAVAIRSKALRRGDCERLLMNEYGYEAVNCRTVGPADLNDGFGRSDKRDQVFDLTLDLPDQPLAVAS